MPNPDYMPNLDYMSNTDHMQATINDELDSNSKQRTTQLLAPSLNFIEKRSNSDVVPLHRYHSSIDLKTSRKPNEISNAAANESSATSTPKRSPCFMRNLKWHSRSKERVTFKYTYHRKNAESQIFLNINKKPFRSVQMGGDISTCKISTSSRQTSYPVVNSQDLSHLSTTTQNKNKFIEFFSSYLNKKFDLSVKLKQQIKAAQQLGVLLLG